MIEILDGTVENASLAKVDNGTISKPKKPLTVGQLELALIRRFPREDAEPWDRMGLTVGDPAALVTGVAVTLDATTEAIESAARGGANVLLTHHPAFLDPPDVISPSHVIATAPGVNVWNAVSKGVALMNFHTALDVSRETARLLPGMLSLEFERNIMPCKHDSAKGYGQLCRVRASDMPFKLSHLAARCTSVFGRPPRVWGDFSTPISSIVVANGAASDVADAALAAGAQCLVCGEIKYHAALDAAQAGLCIVELGHDVSELPLTALLAQAAIDAGVPSDTVSVIDQSGNWTTPESTRI